MSPQPALARPWVHHIRVMFLFRVSYNLAVVPDFPCMWSLAHLSSSLIRKSFAMRWLFYLRLFYLTAGTLLPFFWIVVILGHRRQRDFERIFFFLCLALVCFFGSSLLALNAQLYYERPPQALMRFAWTWLCLGLWFVPPLLQHLHAEYAALRELIRTPRAKALWLAAAYLPT